MNLTKPQKSICNMVKMCGNVIAVNCASMLIAGKKSVPELQNAVNGIVRINDAFRMRIGETDGILSQYISDFSERRFEVLEFADEEQLHTYAQNFAKEPLDLYSDLSVFKIVILPEQFGIIAKLHHLISDAWTFGLLATQFDMLINGRDVSAGSYFDFCKTEQTYLDGKRFTRDRDFFLSQTEKCKEPVFLASKNSDIYDSRRKTVMLDSDITKKIIQFSDNNNCSVFSVFSLVLALYISRLNMNSEKFFMGTTVLNRSTESELNTAGVFVNIVPLLFDLSYDKSFAENLLSAEDSLMSLFRHQKYNYLDLLSDASNINHHSKKLFDVMINYMNAHVDSDNSTIRTTWYHNGKQNESLQINIDDRDNTGMFKMQYDYRTDLFTEDDITIIHNCLCNILNSVIKNSDEKLSEIDLLSDGEKQKLIYDFNNTETPYELDKCVHELFEEQVKNNPEKTAIVGCDKVLTYRELNEESDKIANALIAHGVSPHDFVAFDLKRKSYVFSAIFGILKTGAVFVPVNNDYPEDRKRYITENCNASFVIDESNIAELLNYPQTGKTKADITSDSICYCIYTSGSTGNPKGTIINHKNVANLSFRNDRNMCPTVIKDEYRSICSFASVGFDMFIAESLVPLINGLTVIFANEEQSISQKEAALLFKDHCPDIFQCTPSKLKILTADKSNCDYLKGVKSIILGGEGFDAALFNDLKTIGDFEIYNFYGPTEATVWVSYARIDDAENITIGKPMANTQMHIVDKYMKLVPIGVTGELCIAGDSVSAGYLNRPELTAEKFIDNPFGEGKLYRTGDNAYRREDGSIVFVGRSDFQVKIRGLRIELGEIESAISAAEGINQSVVIVRKDSDDRQIICAFYTGEEKSAKEIRSKIGEKLPKYMIPHIFTHLDKMPLTASGKVNRNALPQVDLENISSETEYIAPATEKEKVLADCIKDVLSAEKVSMLDNFFDMGGDSLKAIELTARLEAKGYTVAVKTIFSCQDIKELAKELEEKENEEIHVEYGSVIPATAAQLRVYTAQMMKPDSTMYNVTFAFRMEDVDKTQLERAINALIERHESLRTRFENKNGQIMQIVEKEAAVTVENVTEEAINSFDRPFELDKAPLVRVGCNEKTVVISMHHIITDGESMPVFIREFNELYMGREIIKSAVQYGEFAVTDIYTKENEAYWLNVFDDEIPALELPSDYPRGAVQSFNGSNIYENIDIKLHDSIAEKCQENGITPFVYYMACFNILLSKLSGNEDIVTGTPVSGRKSRYLDTIGMFVNTIALRSRPEGNKTVAELMTEIRDNSVEAIEHQNYPFGELVKKLNMNVSGRNPLFDVMLAYQSEGMTDTSFTDKKIEPVFLSTNASKCDMTFTVYPRKDEVLLSVEYCTDLYKEETIHRFVRMYNSILEQCLDTKKNIACISITEPALIDSFNATQHEYDIPENSTLYSLFEKTAKENPEKICIKTAERELSFGEFLSVAEKTDRKIRDITGNKKSVIAVISERSPEMYGAIYGIIRGGNAYLPIDPEYPQERIEYILENSNAAAVAVQGKFVGLTRNIPCIDMTEILNGTEKNQEDIPVCNATPEDKAYVIYTSGSTGNPKGAKISHKSAVNRILWMHDKYPLDSSGVILQKTPYTFDVSVWEHFWWGMTGGCLAVSKPGEHFIPAKILEDVYKNSVTHLHFVPSVFDLFLNYLEAHTEELYKFNSVKHVFLSGEALSASLVQRFYRLYDCSNVGLHNLYGPTECTVDVSFYDCSPEDTDPVPIGKPVYNTQLYIVDKYKKPVPVGVQGEICIAGMNVGQGYLNNPELTAEKFIDNPFGAGKLYRTGDIGYWREDGNIVFVGRKDSQIKLNGQRIELGEIEAAINGISGVSSSAVIVKKANGADILAAFFTGEADASYIKEVCSESLPSYMVPAAFMHLDKLPLNPSGKLDRKALSATDVELSFEEEFSAPENETEKLICEVFSRVLNVKNVGRNSDFFSMGGTSLSMISILSEDAFEGVTAADFIRNSTPARLARILANAEEKSLAYLEPLYKADNAEKAVILFPYAGGGAEAFSKLVSDFTAGNKDTSVYFVRYLHSSEECEKAAEEIINILRGKNISVYSHCVGAAVALRIIKILEDRKVPVKHYFAGAVIPPSRPNGKNIWNKVSDGMLKAILIKAGAPLNNLSENEVADMLKRFRKDTDFANASFAQLKGKIKTPVSVIISKRDLFTVNYMQAERLWKRYAENPSAIYFMNSKNHYFQNSSTEKIIVILQKFM